MPLGLGTNLTKGGLAIPGIVTDSLVLKHKYDAGSVVPVSDGACFFNVTNTDYIDLGSKANSGDDLSFSAWVYITSTAIQPILKYGDLLIRMESDTNISTWPDASEDRAQATISSIKDQWAHIGVTIDDLSVKTYLNGVLESTASVSNGMSTDSVASYIGKYGESQHITGYMCNVGIWTSVLTQAQIKSIMWKNYAGLSTSETTNLVSWWNLSASGKDSHGSNTGTLT